MRHVLSILVENEAGALSRIAGLFSARGYNISSLTVAPTEDKSLSRMTIVTRGTDKIVEQIVKQLHKLIEVVSLEDMYQGDHIERELMLVKLQVNEDQLSHIKQSIDVFEGRVLDMTNSIYVVEFTGDSKKMESFLDTIDTQYILEVVRTGVSGITRGQ